MKIAVRTEILAATFYNIYLPTNWNMYNLFSELVFSTVAYNPSTTLS